MNVYNFVIPEEQIEKKTVSVVKEITYTLYLKFKKETKNFLDNSSSNLYRRSFYALYLCVVAIFNHPNAYKVLRNI